MKRRAALPLLLALLVAVVVAVGVKWLLVAQYTVRTDGLRPTFQAGDRVLVGRTCYGLRLPGEAWWGYVRLSPRGAERGDWMAFYDPSGRSRLESRRPVRLARCAAVPGDTLWIDPVRRQVTTSRLSTDAQPLVVPQAGTKLRVTPANARLLWNTLRLHEHLRVVLLNDTALRFDGRPLRIVGLSQPYYWTEAPDGRDSRLFGFVPESALVGRALCISYSTDVRQPFYKAWQWPRFFRLIPQVSL